MRTALQMLEAVTDASRKLGPYLLLEVLLPGGTLFAMMLFVYRHPAKARRYAASGRRMASRMLANVRASLAARAASLPSLTTGIENAMRALG